MSETKESDKAKEGIIAILVAVFCTYILDKFFNFLLKPAGQVDYKKAKEMVEGKQFVRDLYLANIAGNPKDPMYQYQLRFIENPQAYKGDPDNDVYKTWYENWRQGKVLDSSLRWVPEIYDENGRNFNPNFLEYMKIQWDLHREAPFRARMKFLKTIRKYYPEFSADFEGMKNDLAYYFFLVRKDNLRKELRNEIEKYGLPGKFAKYLIRKRLTPKKLQQYAAFLKSCVEAGYSFGVSRYALENNLSLEEAGVINEVVKGGLPVKVGVAYLKDEIDIDDIRHLAKLSLRLARMYGTDTFKRDEDGVPYHDEEIEKELRLCKSRKRKKLRAGSGNGNSR